MANKFKVEIQETVAGGVTTSLKPRGSKD